MCPGLLSGVLAYGIFLKMTRKYKYVLFSFFFYLCKTIDSPLMLMNK